MTISAILAIVLTAALGIVTGAFAWFIKRFVKHRDEALKEVRKECTELKNLITQSEKEVYQNLGEHMKRVEARFVREETLALMLSPLSLQLTKIEAELRDVITMRQQQAQMTELIREIAQELRALRKEHNEHLRRNAPALAWAKRKSEEPNM